MVNGDVVLMQVCTHLQKVRISLDVSYEANGEAYCYTLEELVNRYSLDKIVNCEHLIELVLELTDRHGYAVGLANGEDVWTQAENLAQRFRDRMHQRVKNEVEKEFEEAAEKAKIKAEAEKRVYKVDADKEQVALEKAVAAAQKTAVRTVHIDRG